MTIYDPHPCDKGCAGLEGAGGCQTSYTVVAPTGCGSSGGGGGSSVTSSDESVASSGKSFARQECSTSFGSAYSKNTLVQSPPAVPVLARAGVVRPSPVLTLHLVQFLQCPRHRARPLRELVG